MINFRFFDHNITFEEELQYEDKLERGEILVAGCEAVLSKCFIDENDIYEFHDNVNYLKNPHSKIVNQTIKAVWNYPMPIVVNNENDLLYHYQQAEEMIQLDYSTDPEDPYKIFSWFDNLLIQLVTYKIMEGMNVTNLIPEDSISIDKVSPQMKLGGISGVTLQGKIDTFNKIKLSNVPLEQRKIMIKKLVECLHSLTPKPLSLQVVDDGVIVRWYYRDNLAPWELFDLF